MVEERNELLLLPFRRIIRLILKWLRAGVLENGS
jgi:hypothetical protein